METTDGSPEDVMPFDWQSFDFLDKCVKQSKLDFGINSHEIQIKCFDVNENHFVFGTNFGSIYCFRRHVTQSQQLFKYRLISSPINIIRLITDELLSFVSDSNVYVLNRLNHKFLYGWKCPTKATITCLQTFMSISDEKLLLISGDSDGVVRYHDLIQCQQNAVFKDIGFPIIQIEFIDNKTLLISTSFKTVIVEIDFSDISRQKMTQIGKNERKNCGKFGAVYSLKDNVIYGSRPTLHLIKALTDGSVVETIRINNIVVTESPQLLQELSPNTTISGKTHYRLGILKLFCTDRFVLSVNGADLLIIGTDGQFCMKVKIQSLVDVKISAANTREAFLLLEDRLVIRIRDKRMTTHSELEVSSDYENSCESDESKRTSDESKSSTESLINLLKIPSLNVNPISLIEEELKKVFDFTKLQMKLSQKYNQLSTSIISTIDPKVLPNSDKNVFVSHEYDHKFDGNDMNESFKDNFDVMSPLVVTRKRKTYYKSSESILTDNSGNEFANGSEERMVQSLDTNIEISDKITDNCSEYSPQNVSINEDNRLLMILSAYKEANNRSEDCVDSQTVVNDVDISVEDDNQKTEEMKESLETNESNDSKSDGLNETEVELKTNAEECEPTLRQFERKWKQIFSLSEVKVIKEYDFLTFCAIGYNSDREIGLIWFVPKDHNSLVYYPSFDSLKLQKVRVLDITSSANELYILTDSGLIFRREGMDATKPVGTKWTQIKANKKKVKITSISLNANESILWCCDANGETLTHRIRSQNWSQIQDFSSHSIEMRKVCISAMVSTLVWGIDRRGKIFVRIFGDSGDRQNEICGDEWLLIDGVLASDIVITCDNNVLIVVQNNQLLRRSAFIRPNDSLYEWQPVVGPHIPDHDSIASLSVTEDNEIWLMTAQGMVWHTVRQYDRNSTKEDSDWLLI